VISSEIPRYVVRAHAWLRGHHASSDRIWLCARAEYGGWSGADSHADWHGAGRTGQCV